MAAAVSTFIMILIGLWLPALALTAVLVVVASAMAGPPPDGERTRVPWVGMLIAATALSATVALLATTFGVRLP